MLNKAVKVVCFIQAALWTVLALVGGYGEAVLLLGSASGWLALGIVWPAD